jgi:hypothetical protein
MIRRRTFLKLKVCALCAAIIFSVTAISVERGFANDGYMKFSCLDVIIILIFLPFQKMKDSIKESFDDAQTVSADIKGTRVIFQKNRSIINDSHKGKILSGLLKDSPFQYSARGINVTISGYFVRFYENGAICDCSIVQKPGTELYIGDNTRVKCSDKNTYSTRVKLYPDEYVKFIENEQDRGFDVQGKQRYFSGGISFYHDGHIEEGVLANDDVFTIDGYPVNLPKGTRVRFAESGTPVGMISAKNNGIKVKYKGKFISVSGSVSLYEHGKIKECTLDHPMMVRNGQYNFTVKDKITFYENEMVDTCELNGATALEINGSSLEVSDKLSFYGNGNIKRCEPTDTKQQVYTSKKHKFLLIRESYSEMNFYKDGSIRSLNPQANLALNIGNNIMQTSSFPTLIFHENGNVLSADIQDKSDSTLFYQGEKRDFGNLTGVVFNDKNEIIAFSQNDSDDKDVFIKGKIVFFPRFKTALYHNVENPDVSFVQMYSSDVLLPDNVTINGFGHRMIRKKSGKDLFIMDDLNIYRYSIEKNRWTVLADVPEAVKNGCFIHKKEFENTIFVHPLHDDQTLYAYSISGNSWNHPNISLFLYQFFENSESEHGMDDKEHHRCFVKANMFFNSENKDELYAMDVQEIMFDEDAVVTIDGTAKVYKKMEWIDQKR